MTPPSTYGTPQEDFWAGEFGTAYAVRNAGQELLASNLAFFARALRRAGALSSCIEFGANIGMNLKALRILYPRIDLSAAEINADAARVLREWLGQDRVFEGSIVDYPVERQADLTMVKGVLIHINPELLPRVYERLYATSRRFVLVCEYYNPTPVMVPYRGHSDRLFKRDFAGDLLTAYPDLSLVDYGFAYRRDPAFPQDDVTWFLMEKGR
jgi:pseudaminic acid biosynthesis-associated methylase